jgi:hypothetical protein
VNIIGEVVLTADYNVNDTEIKIENLEQGIYIIKLTLDGVTENNHRLIITK